VAIQQGKYVADIIAGNIPADQRKPFVYNDKGNMATIGITRAVLQIGNFKLSGFFAWLLWSIVHIMYLISYRNRYRVMLEWFVMFITKRRGIRLITHQHTDISSASNYK
jgi:NADH dehydrogenase